MGSVSDQIKRKFMPSTKFQILSDLHLEIGSQYNSFSIVPTAPYLILAGDIGKLADYDSYVSFLRTLASNFEKIFLVLGNHEFYGLTYEETEEAAKKLEQEESLSGNLVLLHQIRYDVPYTNVTILGCTLWTHVPTSASDIVRIKVKDYRNIQGWSVEAHNSAHNSDILWLKEQLYSIQQANHNKPGKERRRVIVVTHHAPLFKGTSRPEHITNPWTCAFASDTLREAAVESVKVWVYGHTHFSTDFIDKESGIRVIANQRGYVLPGQDERSAFKVIKTIEV